VIETAVRTDQPEIVEYEARAGDRRELQVQGRLTWRDANGALRFVSVITRDVSEVDVYVECQTPTSIPLYRLVHFQIERVSRAHAALPSALRQGKVLAAVYRVGLRRATTGTPHGYALRLLVEPATQTNAAQTRQQRTMLY
jgi:hypothetical protein